MGLIPYGVSYITTATGSVAKFVECENCKGEYVYQMTREEAGSGTSLLFINRGGAKLRAVEEAEALLAEELATACDPVPCPFCGWYQKPMIEQLRKPRLRWLYYVALAVFLAGLGCLLHAIFWVTADNPGLYKGKIEHWWLASALFGIGTFAVLLAKYVGSRLYNPNRENVEKRKELGRSLAISKGEFMKGQQQS
jgi:hypothetical protein